MGVCATAWLTPVMKGCTWPWLLYTPKVHTASAAGTSLHPRQYWRQTHWEACAVSCHAGLLVESHYCCDGSMQGGCDQTLAAAVERRCRRQEFDETVSILSNARSPGQAVHSLAGYSFHRACMQP